MSVCHMFKKLEERLNMLSENTQDIFLKFKLNLY